MNKIAHFLVEKRIWLLCIFLLMAVVSVFLMPKVKINTDMSLYLPDDSEMKQGKDIMAEQLPDTMKAQSQIRVMFDNLSEDEKKAMVNRLSGISGVTSVTYLPDSEDYNKGEHALYLVRTDAEYDSDTYRDIEKALEQDFTGYTMAFKNDDVHSNALTPGILLGAVGILVAVLLLMSNSWVEPIVFMIAIGVAVVINMGTNVFLPYVSKDTNSIAAVMQLVLSMDYAIMLSNRYRQSRKVSPDRKEAMKRAVAQAIPSMCSSALTTIVGLLALCFMSFKVGADMGVVFAKGVFFSLLGSFTVLPAMLLIFDKVIQATPKKSLNIPTGILAAFSMKCRYVITVVFVLLFAAVFILKGGSRISFVVPLKDEVADVFPKDNSIAVLYSNSDEAEIPGLVEQIGGLSDTYAVNAYCNTLGKQMPAEVMLGYVRSMFGAGFPESVDSSVFKLLYYDRYAERSDEKLTPQDFLDTLMTVAENPLVAGMLDEEMKAKIAEIPSAVPFLPNIKCTASEMAELIGSLSEDLNEGVISLLYEYYFSQQKYDETWTMSIDDLIQQLTQSKSFDAVLDQKTRLMLNTAVAGIEDGKKKLVGPEYSLMAVTTKLTDGSEEAMKYTEELDKLCREKLKGKFYLIGSTPMSLEMSKTFDSELNKVTLITAIAIFLVVLVTFRNFLIPLILVLLIQCSVYITMVVMRIADASMHYVALLIVQSILMGATIDYAIVFTNFYREKRAEKEPMDAMRSTYRASIRTILTSGLIMVFVTFILGYAFEEPSIRQICHILSIGTASALVMILLILPGILATCDRLVVKRKKDGKSLDQPEEEQQS